MEDIHVPSSELRNANG